MFSKDKFLAIFLFSALTGVSAFAQTTVTPETAPQSPTAPLSPTAPQTALPRIERQMQIFTSDGGSYIGVQSQEITKENFAKFGLREVRGVAIEKVMENSPAAQAGLQNGDVIIRFEGEEVTSARKLNRLVSEVAPDHQAEITILRGGNERKLTVTVGKRPLPTFQDGAFTMTIPAAPLGQLRQAMPMTQLGQMPQIQGFPQGKFSVTTPFPSINGNQNFFVFNGDTRQIGVGIQPLGAQLGDYFGVADGKGLLISNVRENSPAAKAGLKAGDVIIEADGKSVNNMIEFTRTINEKKEGDVNLTIIRNKNRQTVRVTPEKMKGNAPTGFFLQSDDAPGAQQQFQILMEQPPAAPQVEPVQPPKRVE